MPRFTIPIHEHGDPSRPGPYPHEGKARLSIRAGTYRDKPGFKVVGRDTVGRSIHVFTTSRGSAERIKAKLARGEQTTLADFEDPEKAPAPVATPKLSGWGTPVDKIQGDRMADLRPQIQKGQLILGKRFERRENNAYGGVMMVEFGKALRVMTSAVDVERPDGTKTRIDTGISVFRKPDELASAEEVWNYYKKYGIPGHGAQ